MDKATHDYAVSGIMTVAAQPLYFGPSDLFGWYHCPDTPHRGVGVVIVSPNGYDMMSMHWGWRRCAEFLASLGYPVVRFDLHGTGDSPGDDQQPDRVGAWLASINHAIDMLKARSNVSDVVLLGTRLGGTLAAIASTRNDVTGLVLYAPCVSGRTYVRELKALGATARSTGGSIAESVSPDEVLMAGWVLTAQTATELGKLDLARHSFAGKQVLYLYRADSTADQRLMQALGTASAVTTEAADDYSAFAQDALFAKEPVNDFAKIERWLSFLPAAQLTCSGTDLPKKLVHVDLDYSEQPVVFGVDKDLFGVLCKPTGAITPPCLVFINTAANHHVGAHRMAVELSRQLAGRGIASLRMDVGGIGDSAPNVNRVANAVYNPLVADDVIAALDLLHGLGFTDITLTGICSGSYLAYHAAVKDSRINSLVLVNLQRFVWRAGDSLEIAVRTAVPSVGTYWRRSLQWETWQRLFGGDVDLKFVVPALAGKFSRKVAGVVSKLRNRLPASDSRMNEVAANCHAILQRGARIRMIYSGDDGGLDEVALYLGKHASSLSKYSSFEFKLVNGADHTFTALSARRALLELYCGHLLRQSN